MPAWLKSRRHAVQAGKDLLVRALRAPDRFLGAVLRGLVDELGVKPKEIFQPIRVALTGTTGSFRLQAGTISGGTITRSGGADLVFTNSGTVNVKGALINLG